MRASQEHSALITLLLIPCIVLYICLSTAVLSHLLQKFLYSPTSYIQLYEFATQHIHYGSNVSTCSARLEICNESNNFPQFHTFMEKKPLAQKIFHHKHTHYILLRQKAVFVCSDVKATMGVIMFNATMTNIQT